MHTIHALIIDLTLITIYAGITTLICKKLKQPIVLGYVLAGIFAGPYFDLLPTVSDRENLSLWADIGVIFLLFGLGPTPTFCLCFFSDIIPVFCSAGRRRTAFFSAQ